MSATLDRGSLLHKRYRIVEILGQGGMGSVYRAVDENLGVDVAVKENLFTTDEYARQFRLEAVILANLRHTNLPRVTDHFVVGEQGQYLVMDYIEGEDLRQRMEHTGAVSEEEAILVGASMCEALQYLHTRKPAIIHRDVKPGNVRITPDGHIYLVDFGLAKLIKGSQATTTGARAMTPGYSPPEQYGTARTDPRTDIYSLGATLYAALSGVIPEDGLARAMDNVELTPLRKRNPKVSRKLAAAIEKAMAVRPDDRFQTADEFRQALLTSNVKTQHVEGDIVLESASQGGGPNENEKLSREIPPAKSSPISKPPSKPRKKKGWGTGAWVFFSFFLLTLLAAALSIIIFWSPITTAIKSIFATSTPGIGETPTTFPVDTMPAPPPQGQTATPSRTITTTKTPDATQTPETTNTPSISPTATNTLPPTATSMGGGYSQIVFVSDRTGTPQIFVMNADGSNVLQVTSIADGACQPDWSPDGTQIVFISPCLERQDQYPGVSMYIINADGGEAQALPTSGGGDFDPAWSPDGTRIAFTSLRDGSPQIYVMSLADFSVTPLTEVTSDVSMPDQARQPSWSATGTQILYTGRSRLTDGSLQIWVMSDSGQGNELLVRSGPTTWNSIASWSPDGSTILYSQSSGPQALGWLMGMPYDDRLDDDGSKIRNFATNGDFSPDGKWIAYESLDIQNANRLDYDIYLITKSGGSFVRLTNDRAMDWDPVWRPIGTP